MKKLAIVLALTTSAISFQASAFGINHTSKASECKTVACKSSAQIIADADNYFAGQKMSDYLAYEVKELKLSAGDMSDEEAVSILLDFAHRTTELY